MISCADSYTKHLLSTNYTRGVIIIINLTPHAHLGRYILCLLSFFARFGDFWERFGERPERPVPVAISRFEVKSLASIPRVNSSAACSGENTTSVLLSVVELR